MFSETIRRKFLQYFKEKGHTIVPSSSLVPHDDPSLLFSNAGMNQFKDLFLGKSSRDYTKAVSCQKCIRAGGKHNDLENVGHTSRHLTFFEMLGNFSFGDYFKKEAIAYAWEVVTEVFELDPQFIYATILRGDEESFELWKKYLPQERIVAMTEKDNFWAMGETGPCGPCSELLYDRGHKFGPATNPTEDPNGERFFEFWNLVFMESDRKSDGTLVRLPKQSIDTGAGFERVISLKMGVDSLFETDILRALISEIERVFHVTYDPQDLKLSPAFRVIADHLRSLSFAIADGAQPSNIERGYVLRKILRRAVRYGRMLGGHDPFLAKILPRLVSLMGQDYPELKHSEGRIAEILTMEEENFFRTLKRGGNMLNQVVQESSKKNHIISGEDAFKLKDTYGLPVEEIALIAKDAGLSLDKAGFDKLEIEAKERSRGGRKEGSTEVSETLFKEHKETKGSTQFLGYESLQSTSLITALLHEGRFVEKLEEGQEGSVFLNETPFYAEKGGQIGDQGTLTTPSSNFKVTDTQTPYPEVVTHIGTLKSGTLKVGDRVTASVDQLLRQKIANNHSATHLLHFALQQILGPHVKQAGSIVEAGRLRFDFSHHKSLLPEEILAIEDLVNEMIRSNARVTTYELTLEEASKKKEIKQFFGEKYGSKVRVVDMGPSKELCGGTHTSSTGTIGYFRISKESSVAAGIRRIEAVTGHEADLYVRMREKEYITAEEALLEKNKELAADVKTLRLENLSVTAFQHLKSAEIIDSFTVLLLQLEIEPKEMKDLADLLFKETPSLALALFVPDNDRCSFLFRVSPDLVAKGLRADLWMKDISPLLGGKGGGKADIAQGGGSLPNEIPQALNQARQWIKNLSKKSS